MRICTWLCVWVHSQFDSQQTLHLKCVRHLMGIMQGFDLYFALCMNPEVYKDESNVSNHIYGFYGCLSFLLFMNKDEDMAHV